MYKGSYLMKGKKEKQFLKLLDQNQHRIRKLCTMYARNSEERKDLEQEVVLNIWKSFSNFRGEAKIETWVYRIILNVCFKHTYAISKNRKTISLDVLDFEISNSTSSNEENYQELQYCIQKLEFSDKTIIVLFLEDLPYKSIGEIVGISENHVAVKIKRIKKKLFECLSKTQAK